MAWAANAQHITAALDAARDAGVGILCLPELCITGYGCEDMFFSAGVQSTALAMLERLVPETKGIVACFGLPAFYEGGVYNTAALACDGQALRSRRQTTPGRRWHPLRAPLVPPLARRRRRPHRNRRR